MFLLMHCKKLKDNLLTVYSVPQKCLLLKSTRGTFSLSSSTYRLLWRGWRTRILFAPYVTCESEEWRMVSHIFNHQSQIAQTQFKTSCGQASLIFFISLFHKLSMQTWKSVANAMWRLKQTHIFLIPVLHASSLSQKQLEHQQPFLLLPLWTVP